MIKNRDALLKCCTPERADLLAAIEHVLDAVDPREIVRNSVSLSGKKLSVRGRSFDLSNFSRIVVIGAGKASGAMAEEIEKILPVDEGVVNVLEGTEKNFKTRKIRLLPAGHPSPNKWSMEGAKKILGLAQDADEDDLIVCLLSGGGSSLMALPHVSLEEQARVSKALMLAGADIGELNAVRKHISKVKGGRLAQAMYPATCISLIISDVVGNPLDVISSGPTAPDTTTFADAKKILEKYGLWDADCETCRFISSGLRAEVPETPKKGSPVFEKITNIIIGDNSLAVKTVQCYLEGKGYKIKKIENVVGEAREVGVRFARELTHGTSFVAGGETCVTVKGKGIGGRNQELALSLAIAIGGKQGIEFASIGTDGIDGSSKAAGAIVDGKTANDESPAYLNNNDSNSFFKKFGGEIITGPTGTNVNDLMIGLVKRK
ncbi:MAG: glycerate kinase [Candidatus Micrarchaeota archaeon]|nr:glycerate kinase [Candidatus Micrarchaeota archaeon]